METTKEERNILRHTLGLSSQPQKTRNFFDADESHSDMPILKTLVKKGLMGCQKAPTWMGGGTLFYATESGKTEAEG